MGRRQGKHWPRRLLAALATCALLAPPLTLATEVYYILETFRDPAPPGAEAALPFPVQTVRYTAADGVPLEAWFAPNPRGRATVVHLHGSDANRADALLRALAVGGWLFPRDAGFSRPRQQ